ncbi:hypothetical protein [Propionicicella superfundia]|uniref:hypothetical protein n=1 Tax=Propionicicella superfundia TaxID=348582 RepID=UPI00041A59AC|nr:hypothetical protein [Propionicicella superfundia]
MSDPVYVDNPYRAAIKSRKGSCAGERDDLCSILAGAIRAFQARAWEGGRAEATYQEIVQLQVDASLVADGAAGEFSDAASRQPARVPTTAWQVHWRNLAR